ncbi:MarR family transcriptional regulator [Aliiroseovarius crassostreae]|uniref:MarR family transcriptional regulator n=1 Tax=Aliiroseovarius crassostreae TaxID=154981 RepID=A0A9Q9HFD6_9RHOB|nr:MarR family transcriptional regulator [Aliiroseovarius crassostreae]UWP89508.1 MarR family transcriptional regulator [Aliiroseovarius crassostreae]UWP92645.1 MarR family transcriptional regulator [Aliiroseovarius crassostreae]UWP95785.1 MarR family transcriptional regulator [Aliiroseovarius crassostreae]UWP98957.1 MarR family transcriptional regulator [Aliiroseovarius crassostreae]UWQ02151.1 MarR family transcriptional regulator [Aliiroseovarius crassostreae]
MRFQKDISAGYLANHLARLFAKALQHRIRDLGLSVGQFPILLELWAQDGQSQKELVQKLDLEQATVANTLNRMERDGLLRRMKDPSDGRAQRIWLTDQAKALRDPAYAAANAVNEQALSGLSEDEQAQFLALTQRVVTRLRGTSETL